MSKLARVALAGLFAPLMFGQFQSMSSRSNGDTIEITFSSYKPFYMPAAAGKPYSGEELTENAQTLADGTRIAHGPYVNRVWRDSQGRTRSERPYMRSPVGVKAPEVTLIEIRDPVAGSFYILDAYNKIAHRLPIPTQPDPRPKAQSFRLAGSATPPADVPKIEKELLPQQASEQLPDQVIEGLIAEGRRFTTTYPVGSMGNDRPLVTTTELWHSKELGLTILSKSSDPRHGEQTLRLTKVSRAEPDPSLFEPPRDYKIVDEAGGFTMTIPRQ